MQRWDPLDQMMLQACLVNSSCPENKQILLKCNQICQNLGSIANNFVLLSWSSFMSFNLFWQWWVELLLVSHLPTHWSHLSNDSDSLTSSGITVKYLQAVINTNSTKLFTSQYPIFILPCFPLSHFFQNKYLKYNKDFWYLVTCITAFKELFFFPLQTSPSEKWTNGFRGITD